MINITDYFKENVENNDYYNYYFSVLKYDNIKDYIYYDDKQLIEEFKELLCTLNDKNITLRLQDKFILICFYLQNNDYKVKQFPKLFERPDSKKSLPEFIYKDIQNYIIKKYKYINNVTWKERRELINSLEIIKERYFVSEEIDTIIKNISTRNAAFYNMEQNEKLECICNVIENLLKKDGKFKKYMYSNHLDIINDEKIRKYRNNLECFRHSTQEALEERKLYNDFEKDMLIRFGIFIIETIHIKQQNYF